MPKEKEQWVNAATKAAQEAATGAVLALVGLDAETGGRAWDTQNPAMSLASGAEDAKATADEVLAMAGISRLSDALSASMGSAGTAATAVRRGVSGMGLWDSAQAQVAAAEFSRRANTELASRQARLVAAQARDTAKEILKGLEEQVKGANDNFRESMDETFIMQGSWQREGQNYRKDVVVYSTLFDPLVTERASVQGYIAYIMKPVNLKTDWTYPRKVDMQLRLS